MTQEHDRQLIALGAHFDLALAASRQQIDAMPEIMGFEDELAGIEAASAPVEAIAAIIQAIYAHTPAGIAVKTKAFDWLYGRPGYALAA
ncbi:hypothetical protein BQ8794_60147 [Mesorhizobium prunaredense]|uniref:Uncharacterized protein n=1 Tax=Mesorhizobium prunaredense TaxID=1631249 RepID=A0A1R3VG75_9HYPH|nr:hypothetical protein [Mesorhizobium prunaredense]SIT58838.1 hypothetical protein BQ8794_60147 [Mesorhizobium prunaredense]